VKLGGVLGIIEVENKRQLARSLRGVSYDARVDRFTAELSANGVRRFLGSFKDAQEAARAYQSAREADPARSGGGGRPEGQLTVPEAYRAFVEGLPVNAKGKRYPVAGDVFTTPDGQAFVMSGTQMRRKKGHAMWFYNDWTSSCQTCGEAFTTMAPSSPSGFQGITRNCPAHRKAHKFSRAKGARPAAGSEPEPRRVSLPPSAVMTVPLGDDGEEDTEELNRIRVRHCAGVLALVADRMPLTDFAKHCEELKELALEAKDAVFYIQDVAAEGTHFTIEGPDVVFA
jgi:hypothetical protein